MFIEFSTTVVLPEETFGCFLKAQDAMANCSQQKTPTTNNRKSGRRMLRLFSMHASSLLALSQTDSLANSATMRLLPSKQESWLLVNGSLH